MSYYHFQQAILDHAPYESDPKGTTISPLSIHQIGTGKDRGDRHPKIARNGRRIDPVDSPEIPKPCANSLNLARSDQEPSKTGLLPKPVRKTPN